MLLSSHMSGGDHMRTVPAVSRSALRTLMRVTGLAAARKLRGLPLSAAFFTAWILAALAPAFCTRVWPAADDPAIEPRGSPGVSRVGNRLTFDGQVPFVGTDRQTGGRVTFGGP